jgi:tetratricopeptide (TPR) repeat protein
VLLHEILADRKPYEVAAQSLAQAVRQVCELPVAPPSALAPVERRAELRGDLDSIVAKAMEKAPGDRYGSAADLAADVSAHLAHLPVRARRPSFGYLAWKFVRRHRAGALAGATGVLLVAGGVAAVAWQARVAERERARAQRRFDEVRQLAHYVIFDLQDGVSKLAGATVLRRSMIERSLAYLDSLATEATDDPRLQADLAEAYLKLGDVAGRHDTANLGDRAGALASYTKARDLYRQAVAAQPRDPKTRRGLANALRMVHGAIDDPAAKAALLAESTAIWESLVAESPDDESNLAGLAASSFAAFVAQTPEETARSTAHMARALEIYERLLAAKPDDPNRKRNVALCHKYLGDPTSGLPPAETERHLLEALRLDGERLAAEPLNPQAKLDYTFDLSVLGTLAFTRNAPHEAVRRFEEALALRRELWAADRANVQARDRLAAMLVRAGAARVAAGQTTAGEALLHESVEVARSLSGDQRTTTDTFLNAYLFLGEAASVSRRNPCSWYRLWAEQTEIARVTGFGNWNAVGPAAGAAERARKRLETCPKGLSPAS